MTHPEIKVPRVSLFFKAFGTLIHADPCTARKGR
jgi:hypothetical protein